MKTRRVILFLISVLMILSSAGCGSAKSASPESVVKSYFEALKQSDFETASKYIDDEAAEFSNNENDEQTKEIVAKLIENLDYTISSSEKDGDTATVKATIKNISFSDVMTDFVGEAMTLAFSGLSEDEMDSKFMEILSSCFDKNKDNIVENDVDIKLEKTENGWIIISDNSLTNAILGGMLS
ncbi:DUF5105 domain-containing protein [Lachnospiraceae bacterium NSJ-143]|nr:DUF5105 domain-containing protein [Lachnospiraceae bacterium NSJ-143]